MLRVKVPIKNGELLQVIEGQHISEIRRSGIPLRGPTLFHGVDSGELSFSDKEEERTYTWTSESLKYPQKMFQKRFRIRRVETIGETWYEIQEWKWYWPTWDTWTMQRGPNAEPIPIRYESLHTAREAVRFYKRKEEPIHSIVDHL